jgi:hypothetical protein
MSFQSRATLEQRSSIVLGVNSNDDLQCLTGGYEDDAISDRVSAEARVSLAQLVGSIVRGAPRLSKIEQSLWRWNRHPLTRPPLGTDGTQDVYLIFHLG